MNISKQEYNKIYNFYKGYCKIYPESILRYVNVYDIGDLTQEYFLQKISAEIKNIYPKTPKQVFFEKLRNAYPRKRIAPEELLSRIPDSNLNSLLNISHTYWTFYRNYSSRSKDERSMILDLLKAQLGSYWREVSYFWNVFYQIFYATKN